MPDPLSQSEREGMERARELSRDSLIYLADAFDSGWLAAREFYAAALDEALDTMHEFVYGGLGRWLEPEAEPFIALLSKHGRTSDV
jgi:hypothetical protein